MTANSTLDRAALDQPLEVLGLHGADAPADWTRWLSEIGFTTGEAVTVKARAWPGGDPLVVRIGASTFALRAAEAACVLVRPAQGEAA